jgi:hypothetical protein
MVIPLTGFTPICGNIRLVLDEERQRVEIHYTASLKRAASLNYRAASVYGREVR